MSMKDMCRAILVGNRSEDDERMREGMNRIVVSQGKSEA